MTDGATLGLLRSTPFLQREGFGANGIWYDDEEFPAADGVSVTPVMTVRVEKIIVLFAVSGNGIDELTWRSYTLSDWFTRRRLIQRIGLLVRENCCSCSMYPYPQLRCRDPV